MIGVTLTYVHAARLAAAFVVKARGGSSAYAAMLTTGTTDKASAAKANQCAMSAVMAEITATRRHWVLGNSMLESIVSKR